MAIFLFLNLFFDLISHFQIRFKGMMAKNNCHQMAQISQLFQMTLSECFLYVIELHASVVTTSELSYHFASVLYIHLNFVNSYLPHSLVNTFIYRFASLDLQSNRD